MNDVNNVSVGKPKVGGAISCAPVGTALPTSATEELSAAFQSLGYISDQGLVNANGGSANTVRAWGGDTVFTSYDETTDTFRFTSIESTNPQVLKMFYGDDNVTGTLATGITVKANAEPKDAKSYVVDMILRNGALKRIVIPIGAISETGEVQYVDGTPIGYQVTITAMPDSTGNTHYEYIVAASRSDGAGE